MLIDERDEIGNAILVQDFVFGNSGFWAKGQVFC